MAIRWHRITAGPGASLPCSGGWVAWLEGKRNLGHVSPAGMGTPGGGRLVRARGDFHEWRPGRVGEACLGAAYLRRLLTEGYSKAHWAQILPSQPGALATLTQQSYEVGKSPQSRGPHPLATECPLSLTLQASVPEGQGHLLRWQSLPISCCPWCLAAEGQPGGLPV